VASLKCWHRCAVTVVSASLINDAEILDSLLALCGAVFILLTGRMTMKGSIALVLTASIALSGCINGQRPAVMQLATGGQAVANVSDIMSNIKCDMLLFVRDNPALGKTGESFGGVLTFTIGRTKDAGGGVKFGIPIAGAKLGGEIAASNKLAYGQVVKLPFHIDYLENGSFADCGSKVAARQIVVTDPDGSERASTLDGPILGLGELRKQIDGIVPGRPRISFTDLVFSGSVILKKSITGSADINVVVINPSISASVSSEYKVEYEIGTNWKAILKKNEFQSETAVAAALVPPPENPPVQVIIQTSDAGKVNVITNRNPLAKAAEPKPVKPREPAICNSRECPPR
jgi:hypothetical protein